MNPFDFKRLLRFGLCIIAPACLAITTGPVCGQTDKQPTPHQPLVGRAPSSAVWTVTFNYKEDAITPKIDNDAATTKAAPPKAIRITSLQIQKAGTTYHETITYSSGPGAEIWIVDKFQFFKYESNPAYFQSSGEQPLYRDISSGDFEGLDWLDMNNFSGVQQKGNRPVFVFQIEAANRPLSRREKELLKRIEPMFRVNISLKEKTPEEKEALYQQQVKNYIAGLHKGLSVAMLDVAKQLPVEVDDGFVTMTYAFSDSAGAPLTPPPEVVQGIMKIQAQLKEFTVPASHS